jgi:hypothetical protein
MNYESTFKNMPPGSTGGGFTPPNSMASGPWRDTINTCCPWGHFGWPAIILPFVEASNLQSQIDFTQPAFAPEVFGHQNNASMVPDTNQGAAINSIAATNQPKFFVCPSSRRTRSAQWFKDYSMNGGTGYFLNGTTRSGHCCPERRNDANMDGAGHVQSNIRLAEFTDGTSNTFLFLEKSHSLRQSYCIDKVGCNPFFFVYHISPGFVTSDNDLSANGYPPQPPNDISTNNRASGGFHPTGVMAAMVDGHTVFISNNIDFATYRAYFTRGLGESLTGL